MDFVILNIVNVALHSESTNTNYVMKSKPKQEHCDLFLACAMNGGIEELGQECDWM